jgi:hypothetical protein
MRIITLMLLLALAVGPRTASATSGTCTITNMRQDVLRGIGLTFPIPVANGLPMAVEFDEASGTFSMSRQAWFDQFGTTGASFDTGFGPHGYLIMNSDTVTGALERDGTIALPNFSMDSATDFEGPCPCSALPLVGMGLTTGSSAGAVPEGGDSTRGASLDFSTGSVTLAGCGVIATAPGASGSLINDVVITCTLSPIPNQANLPEPPAFTKIVGKAQVGTDADKLSLKTTIGKSTTPLAFATGQQMLLNLVVAGTPVVQMRIASFTAKGKKLTAVRDDTCKLKKGATTGVCKRDGTTACTSAAECATNDVIELQKGRKGESPTVASVVVKPKPKATALALNVTGVDIGSLSGPVTLEVWVEGRGAKGDATVTGTTKKKIK